MFFTISSMEANKYECENCFHKFQHENQLRRHQTGRLCKSKVCINCQSRFRRIRDLVRHEKNRKTISCTHCDRQFCNNEHFQKHLRTIVEPKIGSGIDLDTPINPESGYEAYEGYETLVRDKDNEIRDRQTVSKHHKLINRKIDSSFTYRDLENVLLCIYGAQKNAFKINIGFGFILYHVIDDEFKYYYNSTNNMLFEHAITISDRNDLEKFLKKVADLDLATNYYLKKPSSGWVLAGITNIEIDIFEMKDVPIGSPPADLPDCIRHSKSINALTHDQAHRREFNDNKCFFRCLALHQGADIQGLERITHRLITELEQHTGKSFQHGINISHLPAIEVFFEVSVNVYSLNEDGQAEILYLSNLHYKPMYLNLYKNHFSYITKFKTYAKKFQCNMCDRIFDRTDNLNRHVETCCTEKEEVFLGGKFKKDETLFERLEKEGINVPEENRYYPFISVFDFESLQVPRDEKIQGREIYFKHIPATFSVCSNIPNHTEPVHVVSEGDPQKLVDKMVEIQLKHQSQASYLMKKRFESEFEIMHQEMSKHKVEKSPGEKERCLTDEERLKEKKYKKFKTLFSSLENYCEKLIIFGFNSQKYDIPLIRRYLPSSLQRLDALPTNIIKKGNAYMMISTKRLKYLDICNYLAAGTSLVDFYKAYNVETAKGFFPYQWFDSLDKLKVNFLPPHEAFHSVLTDSNISKEQYEQCQDEWIRMKGEKDKDITFADYVKFYNDHDVIGMVEAIQKMMTIYYRKGLDLFIDAISLPGIGRKQLFRDLPKGVYFTKMGKEHSHIYHDLREKGIVGGPSIIFHRYHEAGVTNIKGKEVCRKIIGFDANSLYLWATAQEMPTGFYSLREKKNDYKRQTRYSKESIPWLNFLMKAEGCNIRHAENHGETRIGNYLVDGYCPETNTVFEYNGCFWHGHDCGDNFDPIKRRKTVEKENELKSLGYNVVSITSCEWHKNPASKIMYRDEPGTPCTLEDIKSAITKGEIFGEVKYDIHVPEHLIEKFSEFPPIFKNTEIKLEDIGEHMQGFCRRTNRKTGIKRSLISSMHGEGLVNLTPLIKWYMEQGLVITDIEWIKEYNPKSCFASLQDGVIHDRRLADLDPNQKIKGETSKTLGNSWYGGTLMDKAKHTSLRFCEEKNIENHIKNPLFKSMVELNGGIFEVEKAKKKVVLDTPIQIGIAVYNYAKLNLLRFWAFINEFLINDLYQLMECDTDSLYIAFARETIDECVKPEMKERWKREKWNYFSNCEDKSEIDFEGRKIPYSQYDKRTPGKYKPEFIGDGMICLNSKVYHIWGMDKDGKVKIKTSCKGTGKKRNILVKEHFLSVLETQISHEVKNAGFIRDGLDTKTYIQTKKGLGYFYGKRKVLSDGVSTIHLEI